MSTSTAMTKAVPTKKTAKASTPAEPLVLLGYYAPRDLPPFLHRLPAELRNRIYELVMTKKKRADISTAHEHPFAQAGRRFPRLRVEILSYVFSDCHFSVDVYSRLVVLRNSTFSTFDRQRSQTYGPGTLALPPDHWVRDDDAHVRFRSIALNVKDAGGYIIADVFLRFRPHKTGSPQITMQISRTGFLFIQPSLKIMVAKARKAIRLLRTDAAFTGFSLVQVEQIAACFEWSKEDEIKDNQDKLNGAMKDEKFCKILDARSKNS